MNIFVTGAAGGIGSTVCNYLDSIGHKLTMIDNLEYGYIKNIQVNKQYDNFYKYDIRDLNSKNCSFNEQYDAVLHFAAITSLPECQNNVEKTLSVNLEGTSSVLEFARKRDVPYVFFTSTSAVYENNTEDVLMESCQINPRLWYSLSKKMAEELCDSYRFNYGMRITTARLFNIFGPQQDTHRKNPPLINYVTREFINNRQPILHSDGLQRRDYVYINDVIDFLNLCLSKNPSTTLNVCTGRTMSVREIVSVIKKTLKTDIDPYYRDAKMLWDSYPDLFEGKYSLSKSNVSSETNKFCRGCNNLSKSILGWTPTINIEEAIEKTVIDIKKD